MYYVCRIGGKVDPSGKFYPPFKNPKGKSIQCIISGKFDPPFENPKGGLLENQFFSRFSFF